ncbi:hypothetical protein OSSY52_05920 [Tepiditoga spiralis]|uniref:Carbohydrate kinase PfkB domain-containing protein n=1 Tax=Tepiditoga spiralis TaxID=2108365 RepID=A0A7G1G2A7_9BACT|nr:hypothetical protein [Tepiditoga spiralis]BBE30451.1 hypothetical protein OSSY52_05920 [Tepiditoga spiralis]
MKTAFKEEFLSIFSKNNLPEIALIGGINIEHIVGKNNNIKTIVGGRSGRLSVFLKKTGLYPEVFSFLGQDEFLNMILNYFDSQNIPITWSINPSGNNIDVRILKESKVYSDKRDENLTISPIFLDEFLNNIENIFIKVEKWNIDILDYIIYKKKNIFLDLTFDEALKFENLKNVYCFVKNNEIPKSNLKVPNNIIIFSKNNILFKNKIYSFKNNLFLEEAISSYQASFIYGIIKNFNLNFINELSIKSFKSAYKNCFFNFFY